MAALIDAINVKRKMFFEFENTPFRQTVLTAENSCLRFPQNSRIMPMFGDLCSTSRTAENGLLRKELRSIRPFSPKRR
jgi:hypothetical protein